MALLGVQMIWTREATTALRNVRYDKRAMHKTNQSFLDLLNTLIQESTKDLNKLERTKFETLITVSVTSLRPPPSFCQALVD